MKRIRKFILGVFMMLTTWIAVAVLFSYSICIPFFALAKPDDYNFEQDDEMDKH
jgi:uncharacterized membrane protein YwaF